jgi:predicted transcriptional regulator
MPKNMTLRLTDEQARELEAISRVDGTSVSETVRVAIAERIEARRQDAEFQRRLRRLMKENQEALARLAK